MTAPYRNFSSLRVLAGYLAAAGLAALFGGYFTAKVTITTYYATLVKPVWAPPGWLFGPVWSLLYVCMSVAMWLVWKNVPLRSAKGVAAAHVCWWTQLALNAAWPVVFWLQPAGVAAFIECALLSVAVWLCSVKFWPISTSATLLMLPYAAWVSFATALSCALWLMNNAV